MNHTEYNRFTNRPAAEHVRANENRYHDVQYFCEIRAVKILISRDSAT